MRRVTYSMAISLDGYIVGPDGEFDWTAPDEGVFSFSTDEIQEVGVHLDRVPLSLSEDSRNAHHHLSLRGGEVEPLFYADDEFPVPLCPLQQFNGTTLVR